VAKPDGPGKLPIPIEFLESFVVASELINFENAGEVFLMILMMAAFLHESEAVNLDEEDVWLERIEDEDVLSMWANRKRTRCGKDTLLSLVVLPGI
jgi:hypothetical protein